MKATISSNNQEVTGKTLKEIQKKMSGMLSVDGPRGLTATTTNGAVIHTELYEGQDYIRTASGRIIR